jgi:iron complex outermembrane receptor protein
MKPVHFLRQLARGLIVAGLVTRLAMVAVDVSWALESQAQPVRWHFSINRAPLSNALLRLAQQMGVQIARFSDVESSQTLVGPLVGTFSREEALRLLLQGTGLTYRFVNDHTVVIIRESAPGTQIPNPTQAAPGMPPHAHGDSNGASDTSHEGDNEVSNDTGQAKRPGLWSRIRSWFSGTPQETANPTGSAARCRRVLFFCSAILGAGTSLGAASPESANPEDKLELIVVTAQRRSESLQDVPISMNVATGEQLEKLGVTRLEDISQIAPAVQLSRTGVYTQPAIRGVTTTLAGNYENNVAIYVDGYYLPFTRGLNTDLVNISQVQVLKGPQGTLFGRNATGGAILVQTLDPSMSERSGRVNVTYERFNDRQVQGYFSMPIIDNLAWNVAANYRKSDDYITDVTGFDTAPIETYNISTKVRWQPIDNLTVSGKFETLKVSDGRALATTYDGRSLAQRLNPGTYLETRDNRTSVDFPVDDTIYQRTAAGKIEYDFGWGRLNSTTAYQRETDRLHYDLDGTALHLFEQRTRDRNRAVSEDLNLTSAGYGPVQYVVGTYYFRSEQDTPDTASLSAFSSAPTMYVPGQVNTSKTKAYASYADVTWQLAQRLFLTGGIRYSHETKDLLVVCPAISAGCPLPVWFPLPGQSADATFKSWTPRGVVRYQLDDNSNVYASYSKGFKSGLISIAYPFNTVDPEKIDAYEIGYKTARGRWRLDTAAYYYNYKNLQVSSLQIINGINTAVTTNAASARIYGSEAQLTAAVVEDFNVSAGVAYTHARYTDFPKASYNGTTPAGALAGLNTTTCVNATPPPASAPCTQDWTGKQPARAPDWTGNLGADYTLRTGGGTFVFAGNIAYTSSYIPVKGDLDANGNYRYGQGAYSLVNLRASWRPPKLDSLTLTAFGENVGNTKYYFYRSGNALGDYHALGQPATWGVSADYRF